MPRAMPRAMPKNATKRRVGHAPERNSAETAGLRHEQANATWGFSRRPRSSVRVLTRACALPVDLWRKRGGSMASRVSPCLAPAFSPPLAPSPPPASRLPSPPRPRPLRVSRRFWPVLCLPRDGHRIQWLFDARRVFTRGRSRTTHCPAASRAADEEMRTNLSWRKQRKTRRRNARRA